jgi:hypothetical protein
MSEVGQLVAAFVRRIYPVSAEKRLQRAFDVSEATAERILAGQVSHPMLARMIAAWGWEFASVVLIPLCGADPKDRLNLPVGMLSARAPSFTPMRAATPPAQQERWVHRPLDPRNGGAVMAAAVAVVEQCPAGDEVLAAVLAARLPDGRAIGDRSILYAYDPLDHEAIYCRAGVYLGADATEDLGVGLRRSRTSGDVETLLHHIEHAATAAEPVAYRVSGAVGSGRYDFDRLGVRLPSIGSIQRILHIVTSFSEVAA